ncbi:MAG: sulfate adenylyltransferase subunit CysN [Planctomycetota bacterium]
MQQDQLIASDIHAYLDQHERKDLLRFLTCGSVDDGKSTLIGRLLFDSKMVYEDQLAALEVDSKRFGTTGGEFDPALLTDGLKAEREQGITIDVAYRYFSTAHRKFIIADTPGHEQYTRNMVTGASTANLAILLVDASKGMQVQTRRHAFIVSLLGIKHVVVAVNKMDLIDYDQKVFDDIRNAFTDFAARLSFPDVEFIPMSALAGENVTSRSDKMPWHTGRPMLEHLEHVHIAGDRNLVDMRFPVQYVLRPDRTFRGYAGSPAGGILRPGEDVIALPSGVKSRIKQVLDSSGNEVDEAYPPMACTVTLESEIDVSRGDVLANPNNVPRVGNGFDAMLVWMHPEAMATRKGYLLKHCTRQVPAEISQIRYRTDVNTLRQHPAERLELNEIGRVEINLARPIAFDAYTRNRQTGAFILIDKENGWTVGAGMILDRESDDRHPSEEGWKGQDRRRKPRPAVHRHRSTVGPHERETRLGQKPLCVWLTGLKGSGKTTIAYALERALFDAGLVGTVLDGGNLRSTLNSDLDFTGDDRSENVRRAAEAARLMCEAGLFSVCAFISPFESDRALARENIAAATGPDGFVQVHLSTPLDVCRRRVSGVYEQADAGEFEDFTGVTAPYEDPRNADLTLRTDELAAEACVAKIMDLLRQRGFLK